MPISRASLGGLISQSFTAEHTHSTMKTPQVPIAKEGYPFIFFVCFVTLIFAALESTLIALTGLVISGWVIWFFRDPERFTPEKAHAVVAPADGKVIVVEQLDNEEITGQDAYKISIFMNIFNVHVNRMPFSGTVKKITYTPGKFYSADSDRGGMYNENCTTIVEGQTGVKLAFVQVAGLVARRIVNLLEPGDTPAKGERIGIIRFGSRVDIYVPAGSSIAVEVGQKVRAGETILGYLDA